MKGARQGCAPPLMLGLILVAEIGSALVVPPSNAAPGRVSSIGALRPGRCPASRRIAIRLYMGLEPLATEGDWTAYQDDETTGLIYYFNGKTGESLWEPPTETFPAVELSPEQERNMMEKWTEYEASTKAKGEKNGFFGSVFGRRGNDSAKLEVEDAAEDTAEVGDEIEDASEVVQDDIAKEVMTAPRFSFASMFSRPKVSSTGVIEDAFVDENVPEDEGAYAGTFTDVSEEKEAEESLPTSRPTSFGFTDVLPSLKVKQREVKEEEIVVPLDTPIKIEVGSRVLPSPEKASWGGEDALFCKGRTFGVFDGVSGAEKKSGVALYSFTLAGQMKKLTGDSGMTTKEMTAALKTAAEYANVQATGASTALVASIGEDEYLRALNLGDSVLLVYRDGKVVAKSKEILHYFDCPYQLGKDSPDRPSSGTKLQFKLQRGDMIVAGSDGIFDNLSQEQIWDEICAVPAKNKAGVIAGKIIKKSRAVSLDPEAPTPYAKLAKKNGYADYPTGLGGKVDDISCVVVRCS